VRLDGSRLFSFHEETPSERKLATELSRRGVDFVREAPVRSYTVDFLIDGWLVVEVDGESHIPSSRRREDLRRQTDLESCGFTVIRIPSADLSERKRAAYWVNAILDEVKHRTRRKPWLEAARRRALAAGEDAVKRRRQLALSPPESSPGRYASERVAPGACGTKRVTNETRPKRPSDEPTMAELFGQDSLSFGELLELSRVSPEDFHKDGEDENPAGGGSERRKTGGGKGKQRRD